MQAQFLKFAVIPTKYEQDKNEETVNRIIFHLIRLLKNLRISGTIIAITLFFFPSIFNSLSEGKGFGGSLYAQNHPSAILDVAASDKGVLIPRVSLMSATDVTTVATPVVSMLVYNTAIAGVSPYTVRPGFYYWNGTQWISLGGTAAFAEFYAIMPPDNTATIAAGTAVNFPQNGPTNGIITRSNANQFVIPSIGTYLVNWQVSIAEPGQLVLELNGVELANTVVGRATGTSQIVGNTIITTTETNSLLSVVNPSGNVAALTISPIAGGTHAVSATIVITRLQ